MMKERSVPRGTTRALLELTLGVRTSPRILPREGRGPRRGSGARCRTTRWSHGELPGGSVFPPLCAYAVDWGERATERGLMKVAQPRNRWLMAVAGTLIAGFGMAAILFAMGLYYFAVLPGMWMFGGLIWLFTDRLPWAARFLSEDLAPAKRVRAPGRPRTVQIVAAEGTCARGYKVGDAWAIDTYGAITPPLCRSVVVALNNAVWPDQSPSEVKQWRFACHCPLADRERTFAVDAALST